MGTSPRLISSWIVQFSPGSSTAWLFPFIRRDSRPKTPFTMHCLEIPVDHRLPNLASLLYHNEPAHGPRSEHVDILSKFGQSLSIERDDGKIRSRLPADELDFGLELARPECTGGLVVALHHPDPSQIYADGYAQEEARCRTLAAIKDLVRHITSGILDISSISVLDSMPFISADYDGSPVHFQSQKTFLHALEAKRPEVVISCFRTKTNIDFLEKLQSQGIGRGPPFQRMRFPKSGHEFTKVNAFHPSYAVNRMRFDGCFRRLLVLEFSQAFARAHGTWTEEPWMDKLRKECTRNAALYNSTGTTQISTASYQANSHRYEYNASCQGCKSTHHDSRLHCVSQKGGLFSLHLLCDSL